MRIGRYRQEPEIPTASMADIAFLLIIFFLLTTTFASTRGMHFELPGQEQKSQEGEPGLTVWVKAEGGASWSLVVDRRRMRLDELLSYVDERLRRAPRKPVLLYTDPEAPYQAMIEVYDELMRSPRVTGRGIERLYVPTSRDVEEYARVFGYNPFTVEGP